ncbi:MAG: O-methyltransferase [Syntrophobacterales bacterium]|jgi:caffeoyl-CoA O-methyltransferase
MCAMIADLEAHFREFLPPRDELLLKLEEEARQESIPIVGPLVGELLFLLARAIQAHRILELGTATGYSAIYLARGCEPQNGQVVTLESDPQMASRAQTNCAAAGLGHRVEVRQGEALALMEGMSGPFDFIFLDIDKESYLPALDRGHRLLRLGGLLVADNVGFAGAQDFNREIFRRPEWRVAPLLCFLPAHSPERDGLSLAVKVG